MALKLRDKETMSVKCQSLFSMKNKQVSLLRPYSNIDCLTHCKDTVSTNKYSRTSMARTSLGPWKLFET